jgi:hypothetical protein
MAMNKRSSLLVRTSIISQTKHGFDNNGTAHVFEFSTVITFPLPIKVVYICNDWKSMFFKLLLTIEGAIDKVLQFIMPIYNYNKTFVFLNKNVFFNIVQSLKQ